MRPGKIKPQCASTLGSQSLYSKRYRIAVVIDKVFSAFSMRAEKETPLPRDLVEEYTWVLDSVSLAWSGNLDEFELWSGQTKIIRDPDKPRVTHHNQAWTKILAILWLYCYVLGLIAECGPIGAYHF